MSVSLPASVDDDAALDAHFAELQAREQHLRKLDEQLNARKAELERRAEERRLSMETTRPLSSIQSSATPSTRVPGISLTDALKGINAATTTTSTPATLSHTHSRRTSISSTRQQQPSPPHTQSNTTRSTQHSRTSSTHGSRRSSNIHNSTPATATAITASVSSAAADSESTDPDDAHLATLSTASALRYQKSRITGLNDALNKLTQNYTDLKKEHQTLQTQYQDLQSTHTKLSREHSQSVISIEKQDAKIHTLTSTIQSLTLEIQQYKKDIVELNKKITAEEKAEKQKDSRCARLVLENTQLKKKIKDYEQHQLFIATEEKQQEEAALVKQLRNELQRITTQRDEMIVAFKNSMKLIDILKKQKLHMEAARMLQFSEEEFAKCLEINQV